MKPVQAAQAAELRLVLISDTHELHREISIPDGDILICAGNFTFFSKSARAIIDFNDWLGEHPHRSVVVPGNHEFFLESDPSKRSLLSNATVLINEGVRIGGLKIWGSPVTPLAAGAFGISSPAERRQLYEGIPDDTDILITHTPPYQILDFSPDQGLHAGCRELFDAVTRVRPRLHIFGHIHGASGVFRTEHTTFVNASLYGIDGELNAPIVFRMKRS